MWKLKTVQLTQACKHSPRIPRKLVYPTAARTNGQIRQHSDAWQSVPMAITLTHTPVKIFAHLRALLYTDIETIRQGVVYRSVLPVILPLGIVMAINVFILVPVARMRRLMLIEDVCLSVRQIHGAINKPESA